MYQDQLEGGWVLVRGKVREIWGMMTGDALAAAAARREQLAGKIQWRRGALKLQAERQLRDFMYRNRNWYLLHR